VEHCPGDWFNLRVDQSVRNSDCFASTAFGPSYGKTPAALKPGADSAAAPTTGISEARREKLDHRDWQRRYRHRRARVTDQGSLSISSPPSCGCGTAIGTTGSVLNEREGIAEVSPVITISLTIVCISVIIDNAAVRGKVAVDTDIVKCPFARSAVSE
jgi:hypothetical protein